MNIFQHRIPISSKGLDYRAEDWTWISDLFTCRPTLPRFLKIFHCEPVRKWYKKTKKIKRYSRRVEWKCSNFLCEYNKFIFDYFWKDCSCWFQKYAVGIYCPRWYPSLFSLANPWGFWNGCWHIHLKRFRKNIL